MNNNFFFKRSISIFIILLLVIPCDLWSKRRHGMDIVVVKKDGSQKAGKLYFIDQESLTLRESVSQMGVKIHIDEISTISYNRRRKTLLGILIGGVIGGAIGDMIPVESDDDTSDSFGEALGKGIALGMAKAGLIILLTLVGMFVGGKVGSKMRGVKRVHLDKMSSAERAKFILKLKSRARIK